MNKLEKAINEAKNLKEFQVKHPAGQAILEKQEELFEEMDDKMEQAEPGLSPAGEHRLHNLFKKAQSDIEKSLAPVYRYFEEINKD